MTKGDEKPKQHIKKRKKLLKIPDAEKKKLSPVRVTKDLTSAVFSLSLSLRLVARSPALRACVCAVDTSEMEPVNTLRGSDTEQQVSAIITKLIDTLLMVCARVCASLKWYGMH